MAWADVTLSTTTSIARHESNVNKLTSDSWQYKIDLAKQQIGNDLMIQFRSQNIVDQYSPLEYITNTSQLVLPCDYLTLALIYSQLNYQGLNQIYSRKQDWYWKQYQIAMHNVGAVIELSNCRISNYVGKLQI